MKGTPEYNNFTGHLQDVWTTAQQLFEALECEEIELGDLIRLGKHPADVGGDAQDLAAVFGFILDTMRERHAEDAAELVGYRSPVRQFRLLKIEVL